jgi:rhodanese-related sulfurtransferase
MNNLFARLRSSLTQGGSGYSVATWLTTLVLVWSLSACASNPSYQNVSVQALHDATEPNRIVLDVRTPQEFAEGHVLGAKLIPVQELEARLDEVPDNAPVYVICRSGNRSRTASEILIKNGKRDVRNVEGGVIAWTQTGFHLEKP